VVTCSKHPTKPSSGLHLGKQLESFKPRPDGGMPLSLLTYSQRSMGAYAVHPLKTRVSPIKHVTAWSGGRIGYTQDKRILRQAAIAKRSKPTKGQSGPLGKHHVSTPDAHKSDRNLRRHTESGGILPSRPQMHQGGSVFSHLTPMAQGGIRIHWATIISPAGAPELPSSEL